MFIVTLFVIFKIQKQPKGPSTKKMLMMDSSGKLESVAPLSNRLTDGAGLTGRAKGTGEPEGSPTPPAISGAHIADAAKTKAPTSVDGRLLRLWTSGCQTRWPNWRPRRYPAPAHGGLSTGEWDDRQERCWSFGLEKVLA